MGVIDVNITGLGDFIGGLVGLNGYYYEVGGGTIIDCYSTGMVTGNDTIGGLVGRNEDWRSQVTQCFSTCSVSGNNFIGGLVGSNYGSIDTSYSTGLIRGGSNIGGLVGFNRWRRGGSITTSYSTSTVTGESRVGGLVGWNDGSFDKSYSSGVVSGKADVGGLVGYDDFPRRNACFWDIETSGQAESAGGTGKTTAEMQTACTFLEGGWDFVDETANGTEDIWWILEGRDYPRLWWEEIEQ